MPQTKTKPAAGASKSAKPRKPQAKVRQLRPGDLDAVIAIDEGWIGRSRRGFFEKRLAAVQEAPDRYLTLGVEAGAALAGYVIARLARGEFGDNSLVAAIDAVGVDRARQGQGFGKALIAALDKALRDASVRTVFSQTDWDNRGLLDFFAAAGFELSPRALLEREVNATDPHSLFDEQDNPFEITERPPELDFSDPSGDDYQSLARDRVAIRSMTEADIDAIVDIDRRVMGVDRSGYYRRLMDQAFGESGVRVSLAALRDGQVAGYIMARVDYGEFGRTEPVAVMDAMGVHPAHQQQAIGTALMSQLLMNLSTLMIDRVRTVVRWDGFDLLRFLAHAGFAPSQRLALWRRFD